MFFVDSLKKHWRNTKPGSVNSPFHIPGMNVSSVTFMHNARYKMSIHHQEMQEAKSVLKRDDRVHFVDMVWSVPKYSSKVIFVGRIVQLYLLTESSILGERVHLSSVIHNLQEKGHKKIMRRKCSAVLVRSLRRFYHKTIQQLNSIEFNSNRTFYNKIVSRCFREPDTQSLNTQVSTVARKN